MGGSLAQTADTIGQIRSMDSKNIGRAVAESEKNNI